MRPVYEEFDEFDFNDTDLVSRYMREQEREERRLASKRRRASVSRRRPESFDVDDDNFNDVESYEEYNEYDEDEFDTYSGISPLR